MSNFVHQDFFRDDAQGTFPLVAAKILEVVETEFGVLTQGKPVRIFISYSHKDPDITHELARLLRKTYDKVWYDPDLTGGDQWKGRLKKEIEDCTVFILVLSQNWLDSSNCYEEFEMAAAQKKFIIPVQLPRSLKVPTPLGAIQAVVIGDDKITAHGLNDLYRTLIQNFHVGSPLPLYTLTNAAKEWSKGLVTLWQDNQLDQSFSISENHYLGSSSPDVNFISGYNDPGMKTDAPPIAILRELKNAQLIDLDQQREGATQIYTVYLTENLRQAVASNFR